jgi:hypothetical protein
VEEMRGEEGRGRLTGRGVRVFIKDTSELFSALSLSLSFLCSFREENDEQR